MRLRFFAIAALCAALPLCGSAVDREITESWNIARTPRTLQDIWFLQAESVQLDLSFLLGADPYPLTNTNTVVVWEISQGEAYTNLLAVGTGTVVNAAGGVVRLELTPEQSNLTNGTYNGYVVAAISDGTNLTDRLVLVRQNIEIGWSPYGLEYEYVGLTPAYYVRAAIDSMTNSLTSLITNRVMYSEFNAGIAAATDTNAVHSIILNGVTNSAVSNVVDLGTVTVDLTNAWGGVNIGTGTYADEGAALGVNATSSWGAAIGYDALAVDGGAVGNVAVTGDGGAVGLNTISDSGGAVGYTANTDTGGAIGDAAQSTSGFAGGATSEATSGGAIGDDASATSGGAAGLSAAATTGSAVGANASATTGAALGEQAAATVGFSGGYYAKSAVDSIQLGTGTNTTAKTLQVYSYTLLNTNGIVPLERIPEELTTTATAGINTNFTFMSDGSTTGRMWFLSGVLTNITLDVSE